MEPLLFSCRDAEHPSVSDYFGVLGETYCGPGGCFTPGHRPEIADFLTAIGGLEFRDLPNYIPVPSIGDVVPSVKGDSRMPYDVALLGPALATYYTHIGGLRSKRIDPTKPATWRDRRGVPADALVILMQESSDARLESLFPATLKADFFPALRGVGRVLPVSPGYSVYDNGSMCEWLQLSNMSRSISFAVEANRAGFACVPTLGWNHRRIRDLERLGDWLERQGDKITHLAVNAQTGGKETWHRLGYGMADLERRAKRPYHWLVFGGVNALCTLLSYVPSERITLVSTEATRYTMMHRLIGERETNDAETSELIRHNLERERWRRAVAPLLVDQAENTVPFLH